jgi:glycosyltransferase involved in cell wall biosynthesis
MRLVIDLQACQAEGSRDRGIGRYSLALASAMVRHCRGHEVLIALNRVFPTTIAPLQAHFSSILPPENVVLWGGMSNLEEITPKNIPRRLASEHIKEEFFRSLNADIIHTTSLFEGLVDSAVTTVSGRGSAIDAVTLYDLIPFLRPETYLVDERVEDWYRRRILQLTRSDIALAISESSRREGIDFLGLPERSITNVSCAVDDKFRPQDVSPAREVSLRYRFALTKPFVMYTGGIDFRKNIEGLIDAYASLSADIRSNHQLAIVCRVNPSELTRLESVVAEAGLNKGEVIFTGFVTDEELVLLYNLCKVFIFPPIHEGFGLPALEAMSCGAPVIGSNCTSIPEVIGRADAQFDPLSKSSIVSKLTEVLEDHAFRADLAASGHERAKMFSWERSADLTWDAFESKLQEIKASSFVRVGHERKTAPVRPRLAFVSPLPPERCGISSYSTSLLPYLLRYYDIDLIHNGDVDDNLKQRHSILSHEEFEKNAGSYDRVLYHFGNSHFHTEMPALLAKVPGVVVLHDFFLSGLFWTIQAQNPQTNALNAAIEYSHGQLSAFEHSCVNDIGKSLVKYPCNLAVIENATGVITHSQYSKDLAHHWYGDAAIKKWCVIPHLLKEMSEPCVSKSEARRQLGIAENTFVVCSFGIVSSVHKLHDLILEGWSESLLGKESNCMLAFVGDGGEDVFNEQLARLRADGQVNNCTVTGYVSDTEYGLWLSAADLCVQLRAKSRGETSGAVSDGMAAGKHVIVNAHASLKEVPDTAVTMLPEKPTSTDLAKAIRQSYLSPEMREEIGCRGYTYIRENHAAEIVAAQYRDVIESFSDCPQGKALSANFSDFRAMELSGLSLHDWMEFRHYLNAINPEHTRVKRWFVDVTEPLKNIRSSALNADWSKAIALLFGLFPTCKRVYMVKRSDRGAYEILKNFPGLNPGNDNSTPVSLLPDETPILWEDFSRVIS